MTAKLPHPEPAARTVWRSPVGELLLVAGERALLGCWFCDQSGIPDWARQAPMQPAHPLLLEAIAQLQAYFDGRRRDFELPLDCSRGTDFQQAVWRALAAIPCGSTVSYGQLAQAIGRPRAVRAVGAAVGRNPLGIILPCHRVVGEDGALTGYTGGLARKTFLLQLEQAQAALFP
ncbi:MAG: hypothetical protein RJA36_3708 [Pseudomonadota bacterium]|jgi:methylated-DNA-[protein]-cysteine S-methyltransferase